MAEGDEKFSTARPNFFNRLDARARVFFLFGGIIGIIFLVYIGTKFFSSTSNTTGPSHVANAPAGLQSVPGGQQTPEYNRAVEQASTQRAKEAQVSGSSAVPTLMGTGSPFTGGNQCIICSDQTVNIKDNLDNWVRQGKVSPETVKYLEDLAKQNVPVEAFAAQLNDLVKQGKLTPEQARVLLEQYQKQHANALLQESAKGMDDMIKSGVLPVDVANQLLQAQKNKISPSDYAAMLQNLVQQGKISPQVAQQLLAQYTQQRAKEVIQRSIATLDQMTKNGELTPDVEKTLVDLENRMASIDIFSSTIDQLLSAGKLTPVVGKKVLDEYKAQRAEIGSAATIQQMLNEALAAAYQEINDLLRSGKISQGVASQLTGMIQQQVSLDDFTKAVNLLVQQNKLTPDIATLKIADYKKVLGLVEAMQSLSSLQGNNASPRAYADELKRLVEIGALTPDQAARLMQEYQAAQSRGPAIIPTTTSAPTTAEFAKLQQRIQQGGAATAAQPVATATQFEAQPGANQQQAIQAEQEHLQALTNAMSQQAQSLVSSWQPQPMEHKAGNPEKLGGSSSSISESSKTVTSESSSSSSLSSGGAPQIKAGSMMFAVLDTEANSDYPDSPILATIVEGKYKGAKLMGKLMTTKGVSGQLDRISLNFTLMNLDAWPRAKSVTAYGVDPDTARTVLASNVNYHYLQRYGAIMATSFLQGYASSITNAGTATTGIFGTSTTHPSLNPANKIAVGLGQVGTTLGTMTQNYINIPPTVKVDSGVGLGILFMSDVS